MFGCVIQGGVFKDSKCFVCVVAIALLDADGAVGDRFGDIYFNVLKFFKGAESGSAFVAEVPVNHVEKALVEFKFAARCGEQLFPPCCHFS